MEDCVAGPGHKNYIEMWLEDKITAIVHGLPEGMDNESVEMLIESLRDAIRDKIFEAYYNGQRKMFSHLPADVKKSLKKTKNHPTARPKCDSKKEPSGKKILVGGRMYDMTEFHADELKAMGVMD